MVANGDGWGLKFFKIFFQHGSTSEIK